VISQNFDFSQQINYVVSWTGNKSMTDVKAIFVRFLQAV
jgi:hypothetical protein